MSRGREVTCAFVCVCARVYQGQESGLAGG